MMRDTRHNTTMFASATHCYAMYMIIATMFVLMKARSRMVLSYLMAQLMPWTNDKNGSLLVLGSANVDERSGYNITRSVKYFH